MDQSARTRSNFDSRAPLRTEFQASCVESLSHGRRNERRSVTMRPSVCVLTLKVHVRVAPPLFLDIALLQKK